MSDENYIIGLIEVIEELKRRVITETAAVERLDHDLLEERAELRNIVMRLDGLKLLLRKRLLH